MYGPEWAQVFAEILQNLANKQAEGDGDALSEFMRSESSESCNPTRRLSNGLWNSISAFAPRLAPITGTLLRAQNPA